MDQSSSSHIWLSLKDPIDELGLSNRPYNALRRADVQTIGNLIQIIVTGHLLAVRNIGKKAIDEIEDRLVYVKLIETQQLVSEFRDDLAKEAATKEVKSQIPIVSSISKKMIRWQTDLIERQLSAGSLHEQAMIAGNTIAHWLSVSDDIDRDQVYETMATILGASINICEELQFLFRQIPQRDVTVLLSRYGFETKTFKEIGAKMELSRTRVDQISNRLKSRIISSISLIVNAKSASVLASKPALLRIQSALLNAQDSGMSITYECWTQSIQSTGLVGTWTVSKYAGIDPIEAMTAICDLLAGTDMCELAMPDNLKYAVELAVSGAPDLPAKVMHIRATLPKETKKLIQRHSRFSSGVYAKWLSQEIGKGLGQVEDILQALGYRRSSKGWFVPILRDNNYTVTAHDVFHHAVRKMFQYCGPLSVDDICAGVRYAVSRTGFPVPPPDAMKEVLGIYGYESEKGLYYWDGEISEVLSASEMVIMDCLERNGPVVHHSELAQSFVDSELSFPSLHMTLKRSPLFERIKTGLYKLRGRAVTRQDIQRAESAGERIPVDSEVKYDKSGSIIVSATLSVIAVGTGVVFCEQFPNLSGEWECYVHDGEQCGKLHATENEFRHLRKPFEILDCQTGDRVQFKFNTWKRTVTLKKDGV